MSLEQYRSVPAVRTWAGNYDNTGNRFNSHLQELQGVGPFFESKLLAAGIENVEQLARQNDICALTTALLGLCSNGIEKRTVSMNAQRIKAFPQRAQEFLAAKAA